MKRIATSLLLGLIIAAPASAQETAGVKPVPPPAEDVIGQAADMPQQFEARPAEWESAATGERICPGIYADPRDGTTLRLVRSVSSKIQTQEGVTHVTRETSYGDYWINGQNRYGIELGQALRIDCVTAKPIGLVARFPDS